MNTDPKLFKAVLIRYFIVTTTCTTFDCHIRYLLCNICVKGVPLHILFNLWSHSKRWVHLNVRQWYYLLVRMFFKILQYMKFIWIWCHTIHYLCRCLSRCPLNLSKAGRSVTLWIEKDPKYSENDPNVRRISGLKPLAIFLSREWT